VATISPNTGGTLHSVRVYPAFRLLMLGTLASSTAFWMYQVASGWLALQLLNSPLFVGLTGFAGGIPLLIFSIPIGMIIDRFDRRRILLSAQVGVAGIAALFAFMVGFDLIAPWSLLFLAACYGTAMSFIFPTRTTIVPSLVERDNLANAMALNAAGQNATRVVGPALAGVLIATVGISGTFIIVAILQLLGLLTTVRLPSIGKPATPQGESRSPLIGLRVVLADPYLVNLMLLALATNILVIPYLNMMPVFAQDELGLGATGLGVLLASTGLGTVAGALTVARSRRLVAWGHAQAVTAAGFAFLVLIFALTPVVPLAVPLLFAAGWLSACFLSISQTVLQLRVDDHVRGRVLSIYLLSWGIMPVGQLAIGALANRMGAPLAVALACSLSLALIGLITLRKVSGSDATEGQNIFDAPRQEGPQPESSSPASRVTSPSLRE
jgi:MFS family permease